MSRCFPYPPPGFTVRRSNEEAALIESIKLQKEREKAKAERKEEKKRDRKERKKEKKEKSKQNLTGSSQRDNSHKKDTSEFNKGGHNEKKRSFESEQLERSNLTEEYGQAVCSQNPNNSSDSTQNSNKRRRNSSSPNVTRPHGNVIRIRLSSQKHVEHDSSAQNEQNNCSTSGRIELPVQHKCETADNICNTLQQAQNAIEKRILAAPQCSKTVQLPMHKDELQYRNLIENWVPPSLNEVGQDDDQDWLLKRNNDNYHAKKPIPSTTSMLCSSSALGPRAQYLQEAEIFALPFTVPF